MPLYAFGSNGSGQLGVGHRDDISRPTLHITQFPNKDATPTAVKAGGNHTIIIYPPGEVSVCGKVLVELKPETYLESFPLNTQAKFCSATWETVTTCTDAPESLIIWGRGDKGELGTGGYEKEMPFCTASPLEFGHQRTRTDKSLHIVDLASGLYHSVVVLSNGEAWGWGVNRKGQIDRCLKADGVRKPTQIRNVGFEVKRAVCGREFTYLVGDQERGEHKILGGTGINAKTNVAAGAPETVPGWVDVGANWAGIFVLFNSGKLVSWGRDDHGQMCPPELPRIKKIAIGSEHALAIDVEDRVLAWGWGEHGNCGPLDDDDKDVKGRWAVIEIPNRADQIVEGVGAGCATSWIWTRSKQEDPPSEIARW